MARPPSVTQALVQALGWRKALAVGLKVLQRLPWEAPFRELPRTRDSRERKSRQQIIPAIVLYRVLLRTRSQHASLEIMAEVIRAGAVEHLTRSLGDLNPEHFQALSQQQREHTVRGWLARFFTAETTLDEVSADSVRFTVTRCQLARLAEAAGHPELAPLFCRGDADFFATRTPPVSMRRVQTLAEGGDACPFELSLMSRPSDL